jgi:hypothetical protein
MKATQLLVSILAASSLHIAFAGCVDSTENDSTESDQADTGSLPGGLPRFALARCESPAAELAGHPPIVMDIVLAPNGKVGSIEQIGTQDRRGFKLNVVNTKKNVDGSVTLNVDETQGDGLGGYVVRVHLNPAKKSLALRWVIEDGTHATERVDTFNLCKLSNIALLTK